MTKLIELLAGLFGKYLAHATVTLGKKYAMAATIFGVWLTFTVGFATAITVIFNTIAFTLTYDQYIAFGFSLIPANSTEVVSSIFAAYAASWSYIFYMRILNLKKGVFQTM